MESLALTLLCCIIALARTDVLAVVNTTIQSPRVTDWGYWGPWESCPERTFVQGMQLKTQIYQGPFVDDSGLNGIQFFCGPIGGDSDLDHSITSKVGPYGEYNRRFLCNGPATGFQLQSEEGQGWGDDTAANNLRLQCDGKVKEGDGTTFGYWTAEQSCPTKSAICGLRTQVEDPNPDNTALNNLEVMCCPVPDPSENCTPYDYWDLLLECNNLEAVSETTCSYEKKIGTTYWNMLSESNYLLSEIYNNIGFSLSNALFNLPGNFAAKLGWSVSTGYNWTSSSGDIWREETSISVGISVPPGIRTSLYQAYGKCDFYSVRANVFKRVDTDTKTLKQTVSIFEA